MSDLTISKHRCKLKDLSFKTATKPYTYRYASVKTSNLQTMKIHKTAINILTLCLHTNLFADIAPNPIKAKSVAKLEIIALKDEKTKIMIELK